MNPQFIIQKTKDYSSNNEPDIEKMKQHAEMNQTNHGRKLEDIDHLVPTENVNKKKDCMEKTQNVKKPALFFIHQSSSLKVSGVQGGSLLEKADLRLTRTNHVVPPLKTPPAASPKMNSAPKSDVEIFLNSLPLIPDLEYRYTQLKEMHDKELLITIKWNKRISTLQSELQECQNAKHLSQASSAKFASQMRMIEQEIENTGYALSLAKDINFFDLYRSNLLHHESFTAKETEAIDSVTTSSAVTLPSSPKVDQKKTFLSTNCTPLKETPVSTIMSEDDITESLNNLFFQLSNQAQSCNDLNDTAESIDMGFPTDESSEFGLKPSIELETYSTPEPTIEPKYRSTDYITKNEKLFDICLHYNRGTCHSENERMRSCDKDHVCAACQNPHPLIRCNSKRNICINYNLKRGCDHKDCSRRHRCMICCSAKHGFTSCHEDREPGCYPMRECCFYWNSNSEKCLNSDCQSKHVCVRCNQSHCVAKCPINVHTYIREYREKHLKESSNIPNNFSQKSHEIGKNHGGVKRSAPNLTPNERNENRNDFEREEHDLNGNGDVKGPRAYHLKKQRLSNPSPKRFEKQSPLDRTPGTQSGQKYIHPSQNGTNFNQKSPCPNKKPDPKGLQSVAIQNMIMGNTNFGMGNHSPIQPNRVSNRFVHDQTPTKNSVMTSALNVASTASNLFLSKSAPNTPTFSRVMPEKLKVICKDWNSGRCKATALRCFRIHKCWVCDSTEHNMRKCPERNQN